jgi:hypothetical protein
VDLTPPVLKGRWLTLEPPALYYSILDTEWPAVKGRLEARLAAT